VIHPITSRGNSRIKLAVALERPSYCRKRNRFLMEGPKFVRDHLSRGGLIDFVVLSQQASSEAAVVAKMADSTGHSVILVPDDIYAEISNTDTPQGITAICQTPEYSTEDLFTGRTVLVLDKVTDPGNAGTAIRSASAFGCAGVIFLKGSVFPWSPKVTRSAAGHNSAIPICEVTDLKEIQAKHTDYSFLGARSDGKPMTKLFNDLVKPACIIIGSEAHGLSQTSESLISDAVSIPMVKDVESLNAGVSASILLSLLFRTNS